MADRSADMTLALTVDALQRLEDPAGAIAGAREWTEYIGVVAADTNAGLNYTRNQRIKVDFFSGTRTIEETLFTVGGNYPTERHVLIGTDANHASIAAQCGWEFQELSEAAEKASWTLHSTADKGNSTKDGDSPGLLARLWPF